MSLQNLQAEMDCIGLAMFDASARAELLERVAPFHFSEPANRDLWELITTGVTEPVLIKQRMGDHHAFKQLGGLRYLADVIDKCPPTSGIGAAVEALIDAWTRRQMDATAKEMTEACRRAPGPAETVLHDAERALAEIAKASGAKPAAVSAGLTALDMLDSAYAGDFAGQPVGIEPFDHVTGGIHSDDLWFIGGRTSMGKSVVAVSIARALARQGLGVLFFSLEMPLREVQARLVADAAFDPEAAYRNEQVRYGDILKGRGGQSQQSRARMAARELAGYPIAVNDMGGLTISDIRAQSLRQFRAWEKAGIKPGGIIIDHIGLVTPDRKTDNKAADTADTVNALKPLAKTLGAPVIALVQVNRQTESRNDKRPTVADLNWSGAIEQAGDLVCLLYREAYYLERSPAREDQDEAVMKRHDLELIVAKNRQGPICTVNAFIDVACNAVRAGRAA